MGRKEEVVNKFMDMLINRTKDNTLVWNSTKFKDDPESAPSFFMERAGYKYKLEKNESRYELELKAPNLSPFYVSSLEVDGIDAQVVRLYNLVASKIPKLEEYMEKFIENLE